MTKSGDFDKEVTARILKAGHKIFQDRGYDAPIADIASEAACSVGAINRRYPLKSILYRAIYGHEPITADIGREIMAILQGFALNRQHLSAPPEHADKLAGLLDLAERAIGVIWPEEAPSGPSRLYCEALDADLHPCPFCGSLPTVEADPAYEGDEGIEIRCDNYDCHAMPVITAVHAVETQRKADARDRWNGRAWK